MSFCLRHVRTDAGSVVVAGASLATLTGTPGHGQPRSADQGATPAELSTLEARELPYGLGWFVQRRSGATVLWHYGWDRANSTLLIKVPELDATFVLLGNSEALSRKFDLGRDQDVTRSPFAREFLKVIELQ